MTIQKLLKGLSQRKAILILLLFMVALSLGLFRGYQFLTFHQPGTAGSIKLSVPSNALPEGVAKNEVSGTVLNIFELPKNVKHSEGEDIIVAAVKLEPNGIELSEPVEFTIKVFATHEFMPKVWHVSKRGTQEITNLRFGFNGAKEELTITGQVMHFLELAATKTESEETAREFVQRHQEEADWLKQQAERETFWSEKAKRYRELADKAIQWQGEGFKRFEGTPGEAELPQLLEAKFP